MTQINAAPGRPSLREPERTDVLRYWLAIVQSEEALTLRPKARRDVSTSHDINFTQPVAGQDYMKVSLTEAARFVTTKRGSHDGPLTPEGRRFFEDWLYAQYRFGQDADRSQYLISFPSVLLANGELGGLLRFPVLMRFSDAQGRAFKVPTVPERKALSRGKRAAPAGLLPVSVHFETTDVSDAQPDAEGSLPYFVDVKLLSRCLKIDGDRIDSFFERLNRSPVLRPKLMVETLVELLREQFLADGGVEASSAGSSSEKYVSEQALLGALSDQVKARLAQLGARERSYPVGLLINGARNRATFHVQRDLRAAIELSYEKKLQPDSALGHYLGSGGAVASRKMLWGRIDSEKLTSSQRGAGELALGSVLAAVQGPPGTGKTTLIRNLAAHALVEKMLPMTELEDASRGQPTSEILVVASTNNRAVDNATERFSRGVAKEELPLGLRVGSRDVIERVTLPQLRAAQRWLKGCGSESTEALTGHCKDYRALRGELGESLRELTEAALLSDKVSNLSAALSQLDTQAKLKPLEKGEPLPDLLSEYGAINMVRASLAAGVVARRLSELSRLAEPDTTTSPFRLHSHWQRTVSDYLPRLHQELGVKLELVSPPEATGDDDQQRDAWEQQAEDALATVLDLQLALERASHREKERGREAELRAELLEIKALKCKSPTPQEPDWSAIEEQLAQLFAISVKLRTCWARQNKEALLRTLTHVIDHAQRTRSLRGILEAPRGHGAWLRRLFPVWGCTLLSLGNNFPASPASVDRIVVDEAAQCHAAYLVSALLRAKSALVIGDVHQLEPVLNLSRADERRILRGLALRTSGERLLPWRVFQGNATSGQSVADASVLRRPVLIDHFRCQPDIVAISEALCRYGLVSHTPLASCAALMPELADSSVHHLPTEGAQSRYGGSWMNQSELDAIVGLAALMLRRGLSPDQLGIITPFRGQLEGLWRVLRQAKLPIELRESAEPNEEPGLFGGQRGGIALGTVHRFQGGERRVILFSTTASESGSLRFLDSSVNLINVAASRAREHLVTVGHGPTLLGGRLTRHLLTGATRLALDV